MSDILKRFVTESTLNFVLKQLTYSSIKLCKSEIILSYQNFTNIYFYKGLN